MYGGLIGSQLEQQYIWGAYWLAVRAAICTGGLLGHSQSSNMYGGLIGSQLDPQHNLIVNGGADISPM